VTRPKKPDPELDAAIDAVVQGPLDEGRRRVLADLLLERGDPRGEFLLLQFLASANQASGAVTQRMNELWRRHRHEWMKGVEQAFDELKLENGFPSSGRLRLTLQPWVEAELKRSPMIATLRHLEAVSPPHAVFRELIVDRRLAQLESLKLDDRALLEVAANATVRRFKRLHLRFVLHQADVTLLVSQPAFSVLDELIFSVDRDGLRAGAMLEALDAHPALDRVQVAGIPFGSLPAAVELLTRWPRLGFSRVGVPGTIELERGDEGTWLMLQNLETAELIRLRKLVPPDVKRAMISRNKRRATARSEELDRAWQGVAVTWA